MYDRATLNLMKILGIDPGTATTGYGSLNWDGNGIFSLHKFGWIETDKTLAATVRLNSIYRQMMLLLTEMKPDAMIMEKVFFFSNAKTIIRVSQAQGVILLAADHCGIPVHELTPSEVKKIVTGNGRAKKPEMQTVIKRILKFKTPDKKKTHFDDVADALAVALSYIKKSQLGVHEGVIVSG